MPTLFISDLHLSKDRPDKLQLFYEFIARSARHADALYILGDLFEMWLGDDDTSPPNAKILDSLASLGKNGTPLFVMRGNRDFLMGPGFQATTGCKLLPDPSVVMLYGVRTLLMHGDSLCTKDVEYQALRRRVTRPEWQQAFLRQPLHERRALANQLRATSVQAVRDKALEITDVEPAAVEATMAKHNVRRLIHGHTHRPAIHDFTIRGERAERIVLGDWYVDDKVLVCEENRRRLMPATEVIADRTHRC